MRWLMLLRTALLISSLLTFDTSGSVNALASKLTNGIDTHPFRVPDSTVASDISPPALILHRRSFKIANALGPGWVGHFIPSPAVYPAAIGAQIFGKFYGGIVHHASSVWTATAPTNFYTISIGTIKLYIWSEDSAVQIGWDFVQSFAAAMLNATQRGFVGLLDATFVHVVSGVMVH
ncbi:MAG: hypothetical protein L6R42_011268, partial [Xanthoria sp. 1 TBL-2021]